MNKINNGSKWRIDGKVWEVRGLLPSLHVARLRSEEGLIRFVRTSELTQPEASEAVVIDQAEA